GGAVAQASRMLAKRASRIGAWLLQTETADVRIANGSVVGRGASVTLREVARAWYLQPQSLPPDVDEGGLEVTAGYRPARDMGTFSSATHAALVAVDPGTGLIEILDYVVVEDGGKLVNPMIVDGQVQGGTAQGIGTCLSEAVSFDAQGQPLASTMLDYLIPGAAEGPDIPVLHIGAYRIRHQRHRRRRRGGSSCSDRLRGQRRFARGRRRSARSTAHARANPRCDCRRCGATRGAATMKPTNFEFARATGLAEAATI